MGIVKGNVNALLKELYKTKAHIKNPITAWIPIHSSIDKGTEVLLLPGEKKTTTKKTTHFLTHFTMTISLRGYPCMTLWQEWNISVHRVTTKAYYIKAMGTIIWNIRRRQYSRLAMITEEKLTDINTWGPVFIPSEIHHLWTVEIISFSFPYFYWSKPTKIIFQLSQREKATFWNIFGE